MLSRYVSSLINQLGPVVIGGVVAFLIKEIVPVSDVAIDLFNKKKDAVANQIGIDKYNANLSIAKNIWNMVDEEFRITPTFTKTIESDQAMFTDKILKVIPGLTQDEIDHLRQAVAGEVNKGKNAITAPAEVKQVITPVKKYYDENGNELQLVTAENTTDKTAQDSSTAPVNTETSAAAPIV
jgi:hypothetical protein